jgi:putative flippase GtrA
MNRVSEWASAAIRQSAVVRYFLTGGFTSLVDFSGYSLLTLAAGLNEVFANLLSTSITMLVSFAITSSFVFQTGRPRARTFLPFVGFTAFTAFVVQSLVIVGVLSLAEVWGITQFDDAIALGAKICAMVVGAVANFIGYRFVFTPKP